MPSERDGPASRNFPRTMMLISLGAEARFSLEYTYFRGYFRKCKMTYGPLFPKEFPERSGWANLSLQAFHV